VKTYLTLEYCDHAEHGCPLATLAPKWHGSTNT